MRKVKNPIKLMVALLFATPVWADYEQPSYVVVLQEGPLAIRDYGSAMVVETRVSASRQDAAGDAFRRLFRYISGKNETNLEIPMTAPVAQTIAEGSPNGLDAWHVRFFLPSNMGEENIPKPSETDVSITRLPAQRYASVSFKGTQNDEKVASNISKLEAFIIKSGYEISGPPVYAFYDPPFIPWFLRDNEILLPVESVRLK